MSEDNDVITSKQQSATWHSIHTPFDKYPFNLDVSSLNSTIVCMTGTRFPYFKFNLSWFSHITLIVRFEAFLCLIINEALSLFSLSNTLLSLRSVISPLKSCSIFCSDLWFFKSLATIWFFVYGNLFVVFKLKSPSKLHFHVHANSQKELHSTAIRLRSDYLCNSTNLLGKKFNDRTVDCSTNFHKANPEISPRTFFSARTA